MKELIIILSFLVVFAVVLWPASEKPVETWRELHECDGRIYEIVVSKTPSKTFLTEFCRGISQ